MSLIVVGRIGRIHGLRGEVALDGSSLDARELSTIRQFTWRSARGETLPLTLEAARPVHAGLLVRFAGYEDRERAQGLAAGELLAEAALLPDPGPGLAYTFQLIGLEVRTEEGRDLGQLVDIITTAANPVYVVRGARELLVPATAEVLKRVDLEQRVITVALPAGLEDLE